MGAGKSTVGRVLAERLACTFVDLDEHIVAAAGRSITQIFEQDGEPRFRELESRALAEVATSESLVVATGGGIVVAEQNRHLMNDTGTVINLSVTRETILARLIGDESRPLLNTGDPAAKVDALLADRGPFYAEADFTINTNGISVDDIVVEILKRLKGKDVS